MNTNYEDNNHLRLVGKVTSEKRFSHEIYGEKFYIFDLSVARLSAPADITPVPFFSSNNFRKIINKSRFGYRN